MRISDWSSDVCSSDLHIAREDGLWRFERRSRDETAGFSECCKITLVGWSRDQIQRICGGIRRNRLHQYGNLAHDLGRHIKDGAHAYRIGLLQGPRLLAGEIAVRFGNDGNDRSQS